MPRLSGDLMATSGPQMESYAARLASFNATHSQKKKRASDAKGAKGLRWPHKTPSPPQLAKAGFFFTPSSENPDNTTCYLCRSNLDGWEEEDDPIAEHLKHSPSCGWANTAFIEQAIEDGIKDLENPMSQKLVDARAMTFGSAWPHENKRGWICRTQKMIEAGWHYSPTLESDDYARCAYCNLGLDGWEPKDNPYDEHERRSPDCLFFALSTVPKPKKAGKTKKGRASKASRASTQSTFSVASDGASIITTEPHDESMISVAEPPKPAKADKVTKKGNKAKLKDLMPMPDETPFGSSFVEPEDDDFEVKVAKPSARRAKAKKRDSEDMVGSIEEASKSDPNPKRRRTTKTRSSVAYDDGPQETQVEVKQPEFGQDTQMADPEVDPTSSKPAASKRGKGGKGGKKRGSSTARKASTTSTASKASLRAGIPNDEEIDAALAEDLDRPLTDDGEDDDEGHALAENKPAKGRRLTKTRPSSKAKAASTALTRRNTRMSTATVDDPVAELYPVIASAQELAEQTVDNAKDDEPEFKGLPKLKAGKKTVARKAPAKKAPEESNDNIDENQTLATEEIEPVVPKKKSIRQASRQMTSRAVHQSDALPSQNNVDIIPNVDSSAFDLQTVENDSEHDTDTNVESKGRPKRAGRTTSTVKRTKGVKKAGPKSHGLADDVEPALAELPGAENEVEVESHIPEMEDLEPEPEPIAKGSKKSKKSNKAAKASSKPAKGKKAARNQEEDEEIGQAEDNVEVQGPMNEAEVPASPPAVSAHSTPQQPPSPQSSDAENLPPSSRPSKSRPPLSFENPGVPQETRIPLAVITTPVASPSKGTFSKLQSTYPWTAMDIDQIFHGTPSAEKENGPFAGGGKILSSPEKKLTVEEWIKYNAQRGEETLRNDCERIVGRFEGEGVRALKTLEGIVCVD